MYKAVYVYGSHLRRGYPHMCVVEPRQPYTTFTQNALFGPACAPAG